MYNGRGIVEIIQEYANILSEDDINTIAKKACDLYYSNQNEIFNEYYRKIKSEDDLIEVKKIAQKVFAVEATNVNSSVLEQIKSELYNKANDEYNTANIVEKNNLTIAVDIFDLLNDYKNSEYLRNLAYVKSIRSKNFKALVRSLKTAVANPDYDYNQFLELLD